MPCWSGAGRTIEVLGVVWLVVSGLGALLLLFALVDGSAVSVGTPTAGGVLATYGWVLLIGGTLHAALIGFGAIAIGRTAQSVARLEGLSARNDQAD